jgi:DNA-binding MarR family transcriptional regulator
MNMQRATELLRSPGFLLRRCNQVAMAVFLNETAQFDLTPAQWGALAMIAAEPGMDQTRLMERLALDRSSVTKCLERLEARGIVRREVDPADKRARRLWITEAGSALQAEMDAAVRRAQARILEPLGPERAAQFLAMLREVAEAGNEASRVPLRPAGSP